MVRHSDTDGLLRERGEPGGLATKSHRAIIADGHGNASWKPSTLAKAQRKVRR
jgi:hypothetical protein